MSSYEAFLSPTEKGAFDMRRGELLGFAQRLKDQEFAETKKAMREALAQDVEDFLRKGGTVRQVYGAYADVGHLGDDEFGVSNAAIVTTPVSGTIGDNYARGREILRKKREQEKRRKERLASIQAAPAALHEGEINV